MKHITTRQELESLVQENSKVVGDFFATWCGPCKMLAPIIEELDKELPDVLFVKVDVDEAQELAAMFGISSIPTVYYFKDKKSVFAKLGFQPKAEILKNIETYLK